MRAFLPALRLLARGLGFAARGISGGLVAAIGWKLGSHAYDTLKQRLAKSQDPDEIDYQI